MACASSTSISASVRTLAAAVSAKARNQNCDANAPMKPGSVGRVVPNTEVKIADVGTGAEVAQGQEGELWIRGPQIMKGYLGQPEETAACLDREGWYHTGDVGYVDGDGYFLERCGFWLGSSQSFDK